MGRRTEWNLEVRVYGLRVCSNFVRCTLFLEPMNLLLALIFIWSVLLLLLFCWENKMI